MKAKSFNLPRNSVENVKQNTTYDFVKFYKSAADTSVKLVKPDENVTPNHTHKRQHLPNKKKKKIENHIETMDVSNITVDGCNLPNGSSSINDSKVTSTPDVHRKSIIKNKSVLDNSLNISSVSNSSSKPKKRNKSVSFMLDDTDGVVNKRSKSEEMISKSEKHHTKVKKPKKVKKTSHKEEEKENTLVGNLAIDVVPSENTTISSKANSNTEESPQLLIATEIDNQTNKKPEKRKHNKPKKLKPTEHASLEVENSNIRTEESDEVKIKKIKKKKRHLKSIETDNKESQKEDEPKLKSRKRDFKPDKIVQDLENLNIGDNAHSLTNLLDEMTVVDKDKKKKMNKKKKDKPVDANSSPDNESSVVEEKEKVKWVKRRWNKDKKGGVIADKHLNSIIIENLPLKIVFTYKKLLIESFEKFGLIKQVGIAEVYPTEDSKPVFTTTINYYSEDAAEKALEADNSLFEGACIRVKRPLPPTLTTLVVRSYGEVTEQALSSIFSTAGRIRNIRHLVKGKKSLSTAFIEFDGPKSVERAIKMAKEAKIDGKKVHVAKFDLRAENKKAKKDKPNEDNEGSDNSNN